MKKNSNYGSKWMYRFKGAASFAGSGAIAANFASPKPVRRKFVPKPHLEKIGGMHKDVRAFISLHCDLSSVSSTILRTSISESILQLPKTYETIINLKRVNDIREINHFFYSVNLHLPIGGKFVGCVETKYLRRQRIMKKFPPVLNTFYYILDFILKRVFPKLPVTRNIYFWLTGGRNKVLSRTETLGRLYAAGFEIIEKKFIGSNLYFVATKVKKPLFNHERHYGPIFKMRRHGKNGKVIYVYKMRTMHAYSEYIQAYVYEKNKLDEGGKMKDDFRVSTLGKMFRKYWIDELPMIWNLLRGDLKLVGVRPLSAHYLSLYSDELKHKRAGHKPGLIPPFYVDLPKTIEDIQASEMRYLSSYEKHPVITDCRYFFAAFYNILIKKARSK
ncbi:MAG: sugar transferase [Bacteroidetes bacterium]|nr:sugar transferase [Bacteroidota bacterium]MBK9525074.1 sugar transferase [Bacteroidota bacterium]